MIKKDVLRICLMDKSSVLVVGNFDLVYSALLNQPYIKVINFKTGKPEIYKSEFIWCIRISSEQLKGEN